MLYDDEKSIEATARIMVNAFGKQRYIANLGHGLYPDLDKNKVKFFIDCVKGL
jgi:uroporphyrinogen decarboxylase